MTSTDNLKDFLSDAETPPETPPETTSDKPSKVTKNARQIKAENLAASMEKAADKKGKISAKTASEQKRIKEDAAVIKEASKLEVIHEKARGSLEELVIKKRLENKVLKQVDPTNMPQRIVLQEDFEISVPMPGHPSVLVGRQYRLGQVITNPADIKFLLEHNVAYVEK